MVKQKGKAERVEKRQRGINTANRGLLSQKLQGMKNEQAAQIGVNSILNF